MRIALFATCLADGLFPQVGHATATVLRRLGHEVVLPRGQTCCGQMHINTGYPELAVPLVRRAVQVFDRFEAVVLPSASCAGSIRHQYTQLTADAGDEQLGRAVAALAERTYELSELLVDVLGVTDVGAWFPHRVTYHPTCHSARLLRVGQRPLQLLRAVRGIELLELPDAEQCCGFGGTFAVKNSPVSTAMLADKVRAVGQSGAQVCVAGDASCLMHIGGGLSRLRTGIGTRHLAEVLAATDDRQAL